MDWAMQDSAGDGPYWFGVTEPSGWLIATALLTIFTFFLGRSLSSWVDFATYKSTWVFDKQEQWFPLRSVCFISDTVPMTWSISLTHLTPEGGIFSF